MQNNEPNDLLVTRVFDAPCERVWDAWTKPELITQWFAPGVVMDVRELDVRVGGHFRFADPDDKDSGEYTGEYVTVSPLQELSFTVMDYSLDPEGEAAGFKVVFEELGKQTKVTLTSIPAPATPAPAPSPRAGSAEAAWNGCFDRLAKVIQ